MTFLSVANGIGIHNYPMDPTVPFYGLKYLFIWNIFYNTSAAIIKASICVSLLRVTAKKLYRRILWGLVVAASLSSIITVTGLSLFCRPLAYQWDRTIPNGTCFPIEVVVGLSYFFTAASIAIDWSCAIMPAFILWDVQLPGKLKISVCIVLGLGVL
jgi:hypothetical protein